MATPPPTAYFTPSPSSSPYIGDGDCVEPVFPETNATNATYEVIQLVTKSQALKLIKGWEKHWLDSVGDFADSLQFINVEKFSSRSLQDTLEDASESLALGLHPAH